jgi:hypothetical protein
LHLLITTSGAKPWRFRFRYRFARKENMLGFGAFPEVSLVEAREQTNGSRKLLRHARAGDAHGRQSQA